MRVQSCTPAIESRWHAQRYAEIGGSVAGSKVTGQVFPTIGVSSSKRTALESGYRWLDIDYSSGENDTLCKYDVLTQGPVVGVAFRL